MDHFVRAVRLISRLCGYFAAAVIAVSVFIVCEMVFVRFVLNENTIWQTDFVTYSLVAATFIGSPYVLMTRGHVNGDVLPLYLGPRKRWWLALISMLLAMAFCVTMAVLTGEYWLGGWNQGWLSNTMWGGGGLVSGADLDAVGHGVLRDHGGAHRGILARGVEPALALEHHVAGAVVDSLCVDAD